MDGVITTEEKYWACARLTLWELVTQTLGLPAAFGDAIRDANAREAIAPDSLIYALKARAVNSNWDIAYVLSCTYIAATPGVKAIHARDPYELVQVIRGSRKGPADWPAALANFLSSSDDLVGRSLIAEPGSRLRSATRYA